MARSEDKKKVVVYGSFNDYEVSFLEIETARHYANFWKAYKKGITFGDFFKKFPDIFEMIIEHLNDMSDYRIPLPSKEEGGPVRYFNSIFDEYYSEYRESKEWLEMADGNYDLSKKTQAKAFYETVLERDMRLPLKDEIFDRNFIGGMYLHEIINYEPRMRWVPEIIAKKCGKVEETIFDGNMLMFEYGSEDKVVREFEKLSYTCIRDTKLVAAAYGEA